jgi:hypothetical protein
LFYKKDLKGDGFRSYSIDRLGILVGVLSLANDNSRNVLKNVPRFDTVAIAVPINVGIAKGHRPQASVALPCEE